MKAAPAPETPIAFALNNHENSKSAVLAQDGDTETELRSACPC